MKKWNAIEQKYQQPMRHILTALYARYGGYEAVCAVLDISPITLSNWIMQAGLKWVRVDGFKGELVPIELIDSPAEVKP